MSAPTSAMGRFSSTRLRYIWDITKQGPTEVGYAYFRARRRRRNRADDEVELSESDSLGLSGLFDATDDDLAANADILAAYERTERFEIGSVQWFLPFFHHAYFGGNYTILRFADQWARDHGVVNRFHVYDVGWKVADSLKAKMVGAFPGLASAVVTDAMQTPLESLPAADAAIATFWTSAYPTLRFRRARAKFYFHQDYEPQFYAAGSAWALAEETYRFGFPGIVNTPGLADVYRTYGNPAVSFVPAVDLHRYHPPSEPREGRAPLRIFFYGRPKSLRNSFGLGMAALSKVKDAYGSRVEIVSAGENWNPGAYGVADRVENLGVLGSLDEVAALYRSCDIGLVFMLTKHPSYQPFEFMASGVVTVSNANPHTAWFLRHEENCLLSPSLPTQVAERIGRLVDDAELRGRLRTRALADVEAVHWEEQIERVWHTMTKEEDGLRREPEGARTHAGGPLV